MPVDIYKRIGTSPVTPLPGYLDVNDVSLKLAECLRTCLNPPRGRGEKRIGTLASEDVLYIEKRLFHCIFGPMDVGWTKI